MSSGEWEESSEPTVDRPWEVTLAVKLLGGAVAFSLLAIFQSWSGLGLEWVIAHRVAWIRPGMLAGSAILIALVWRGVSWARHLLLLSIAADAVQMFSAASILFAIGGSRLLGMVSWASLGVEVLAACLLLQGDSVEWFSRQS